MPDITLPFGHYLSVRAVGTDAAHNPYSLQPGSAIVTIAPADATKVYVATSGTDRFVFVAKQVPAVNAHINFAFSFAGNDGASGVALGTLSLGGQINGPDPAPQQAIQLAFIDVQAIDPAVTPPPADPGTNVAIL